MLLIVEHFYDFSTPSVIHFACAVNLDNFTFEELEISLTEAIVPCEVLALPSLTLGPPNLIALEKSFFDFL